MNLSFQLTEKGQKKSCIFTAYCGASLVGQSMLAIFVTIYIAWNIIGDVPPVTLRNLLILFSVYIAVFGLLLVFFYRHTLQKDKRLAKGIPMLHCSLTTRY